MHPPRPPPPVAMVPCRRVGEEKNEHSAVCSIHSLPLYVPLTNNTPASAAGTVATTVTHTCTHTLITDKGCLEEHTAPLSVFIYAFPLRFRTRAYIKLASQSWHLFHPFLNQCLLHVCVLCEHKIKSRCQTAEAQRVFVCNYGVIIDAAASAHCS